MQTAHIKLNEIYALPTPGGKTFRFRVTAITTITKRTHKNPRAETVNKIHGIIELGDLPDTPEEGRTRVVNPEDLSGHFSEFAEMKAQQEEDERIAKAKQEERDALKKALRAKLYQITALPQPENESDHRQAFRTSYSSGLEIAGEETIARLLAALERLAPDKPQNAL